MVRYENLVGDRYLEITSGPGELRKLSPGSTIPKQNTQPALDLDALLGGLRPVLKGLDGAKVNEVSNAVLELLQGQGGALSSLLSSSTARSPRTSPQEIELIGDVINNLNTVLGTVDEKGTQFNASVDQLQKLITGLAEGRDPIAGAIAPLASAENDLTDMLHEVAQAAAGRDRECAAAGDSARTSARATSTRSSNRSPRTTCDSTLLAHMGRSSTSTICSIRIKINGPAGSDILIPFGGPPDPSKGRCSENG